MKKAVIVHQSKTGTTQAFAEALANRFAARGIATLVRSAAEATARDLSDADYVLFGCWTSGLLIAFQHPERAWVEFAKGLSRIPAKKVGLFTTYKVATGGMFKKMSAHLSDKAVAPTLTLKARGKQLAPEHERAVDAWIG